MASVSSLDKDMRNIRLSKYTSQASGETRAWIESVLHESLAPGDLLDALKDGTALCKLVNLAVPHAVRFKSSTMPFVQMENISHFLRACQQPPLSLHSHDIFQTVDLYESKDPAQVLQCIAAFSRRAHAVAPSRFPSSLGGDKSKAGNITPQSTGGTAIPRYGRTRGMSSTSETSSTTSHTALNPSQMIGGRRSPTKALDGPQTIGGGERPGTPSGGISSWSTRQDEGVTAPAWNIHQYGYMGGASQGNQGISFGARRQITTAAPQVPSLAEKERRRREQEAESERTRLQAEEAEQRRRSEREAEDERQRREEEARQEAEIMKQREAEKRRVEEEKRRWEEEERRWKEEDELRIKEEAENEARLKMGRQQPGSTFEERPKLQGQYLSQYQAQQRRTSNNEDSQAAKDRERVKDLERQLAEAKEREAQYERERQERLQGDREPDRVQSESESKAATVPYGSHMGQSNADNERERSLLQQAWQATNPTGPEPPPQPPRPLPTPQTFERPPPQPPRPLPSPLPSQESAEGPSPPPKPPRPLPSPQPTRSESPPPPSLPVRPLPNPANYGLSRPSASPTRKSPFTRPTASPSPPPPPSKTPTLPIQSKPLPSPFAPSNPPASSSPANAATTIAAPTSSFNTPSPSLPSSKKPPSSLLAREMELDRQRQQEWAEAQAATASRKLDPSSSSSSTPGGGAWDVHQYGYLGGDSQNRGNVGIGGFGGARRQLVGGPREMPREMPGKDDEDVRR